MDGENKLCEHLYIEYRWGNILNKNNFLTEAYGQIPQIDEYVECFMSIMNPIIDNMGDGDTIGETITQNVFETISDRFFKYCKIDIILSLTGNKTTYSGGYDSEKSYLAKDNSYILVSIKISTFNKDMLKKTLLMVFAHELTHAHEDYQRVIGQKENLNAYGTRTNYFNANLHRNYPKSKIDEILSMVYNRLSRMELNAIIGQIGTELKAYKTELSSSKEALEAIKKTDAWGKYEYLSRNIDVLNKINDIDYQKDILNTANEILETKFSTYSQFLRDLNKRWYYWERKFLVKVSKVAYSSYIKYGGMIETSS